MGPRFAAQGHGEWYPVSDCGCESPLGSPLGSPLRPPLDPRSEEPSTQATIPCDAVQQTPKKANPRRVCPEPPPPAKSWNENAQEVQSKRSRHLEDEAQSTSGASDHDRSSNTDIADKQVNGQRITHDGSCKMDTPEHRKPLLEPEDDGFVKVLNRFFPLRRQLESLLRLLDPLPKFFCGFWELPSLFFKSKRVWEKAPGEGVESRPGDLQETKFQRLPYRGLTNAEAVSKSCKALFRRPQGLSGEGAFTALSFFIKDEEWQCTAMDLLSGEWRKLPTLACLPSPDRNRFQEYSICGNGDLLCVNVSKSSHTAELVVFNLWTGEKKELPPLHYPRNPVLLHIWVDSVTDSYKVIAAGSASSSGEKDLSRRIEVYDSRTSEWEVGSDLPGPEFALNEHQVGVCLNGILHFIMFLDGDGQKGIAAFDIEKGEWLEDRSCAVPFSLSCNTLHLLESSGMLYLFSEQERDGAVEHCIDVLELRVSHGEELWQLRTVVRVAKSGGRGLLVYPEYTCVPFGIGKLCIFNTITRDGVVYDLDNGMQSAVLLPPPEDQSGENFFCLNPVSFTLAPNFARKPGTSGSGHWSQSGT